ncbi:ABC transporter ATP-binding protein [Thermoplasma sp.]|uniref:ABC transporter ATP-binding protein n=1 Tax=Thermoplasma sp. TaxID=1973142 RepID=UPI0026215E96|nr:ABC transporter ATP-binding protein [Thermoplasma sp.]
MSEIYSLKNVKKYYLAQKRGIIDAIVKVPKIYVRALDDVSISIADGNVIGVVGESGSGKSTMGKVMVTLETPTDGELYFKGKKVTKAEYPNIRKQVDMVFQNPATSLNPKMKVKDIVSEPLGHFDESAIKEVILKVGLAYDEVKDKQSRELSGGQVQRVAIARALMKRPELLVLDEPTSALDESIQAQVLNLLVDLQSEYKMTYIFITHNILVAKYISDYIVVLYAGKIVEYGPTSEVLSKPLHPYTQLLLSSVPTLDVKDVKPPIGDVPSLINLPQGCRFNPRCPFVMEKCRKEEPPLISQGQNYQVACWLYE